ncbi:MAG: SemiSWEET transporter [Fibrobacter sp.]|nr:SemiSWEET transporter [Fibrobacter sp.]
MNIINLIGLMAGTLTTISFLPQVIRICKTRSTRDISLSMFLLFTMGVLLWLIYGVWLVQWPIIIPNIITLILALIIIYFKIVYK